MESLVTEHLDIWSGAVATRSTAGRGSSNKLNLYGIKKLRALILELAVRGQLVAQDAADEPAAVLLERIAAEKARLVAEGVIKKQKVLPEITEDEKPFDLPKGWVFVRLQDIIHISSGDGLTSAKMNKDGLTPVFGGNGITGHHDQGNVSRPTVVIGRVGFYCGSVHITPDHAWVTDNAFITRFSEENIYIGFLYWLLVGTNLNENDSATAQPVISGRKVYPIVVGLPPLQEQHRIVTKVNELMTLCDALEQAQETDIHAHQRLVENLLAALVNAANQGDFNQAWQRISQHFDTLFTTEHSIDQLKQTILQLAVMGKLVEQDPNDEPAAVLLEKIAVEKARLVKEKKIKKQKALPEISEDEKPFGLPVGWSWSRLDDICYGITSGSTPPKTNFVENAGIPYLKVYNIRGQEVDFLYKPQFVDKDYHESKLARSILFPGDVVMNIVGPPLGKTAIIPEQYPQWNCNQAVTFFRPIIFEFNRYIHTYLKAGVFLDAIELIGTAGQDNISVTKSRSIVLPTPPLAEQHRIVKKVDQLMTLCDQLKTHINTAQTTRLKLADALAEQAVV